MYAYSHALIGALTGAVLFPHQPGPQTACVVAAALPDFVAAPFHIGHIFFKKNFAPLSREISHSLIVVFVLFLFWWIVEYPWPIVTAFLVGWLSHILVDAWTHESEEFQGYDATLLWPINDIKLGQVIGIWDYRHPFTVNPTWLVFLPKIGEIIFDLGLIALLVYVKYF